MIEATLCSNQARAREIGSYFSYGGRQFECEDGDGYQFDEKFTYLSTCRSAIRFVLDSIGDKSKVALVPSFTCCSVIDPFLERGYSVYPYHVCCDFTASSEGLLCQVDTHGVSVVLIHDYFGFDSNAPLRKNHVIDDLKKRGVVIIVDKTQSMFSSYPQLQGDYTIGSIRKWVPIPDGAFLDMRIRCEEEDAELVSLKSQAMSYKESYLDHGAGDKETLLANYKEAEALLDSRNEAHRISNLSKLLLSKTNIDELKNQRRKNYAILSNGVRDTTQITVPHRILADSEVPFYFPVFVKNDRSDLQRYLASEGVFATIIWACPDAIKAMIDKTAQLIYDEILCIPCDQRYNEEDMQYICNLIARYECEKLEAYE